MAKSYIDPLDDIIDINSNDQSYSASNQSYYVNSNPSYLGVGGTVTLNTTTAGIGIGSGTGYTISGSNGASAWSTQPYLTSVTSAPSITVTGDAEFDGNIKWKGRDLGTLLEKIEDRLAILTPDSKKLEQFAALKKAYDHYKLLEKLCEIEDDPKQ